MARSIVFAALLVGAAAACAQQPVPPPDRPADPLTSSFVAYCGPIWLVVAQGYRTIPCPPDSNYPGAQ